jgi:hypothetical protein
MTRHTSIAALLAAGLLSACGQDALRNITEPPPAASRIRFFNFGVNSPGVNFYAGETKITAVVSTTGSESTNGITYPGIAAGGDYSAIAPGQYTFTGRIAATTDKDLPISTISTTIEDGKYYSYYQSGFYNTTTKTSDAFLVEDPFTEPPDYSVTKVRFVNAISNANPLTLYAKDTTTSATEVAVGAAIQYKAAGAFVSLPSGVYNLSARFTGATTNALTRPNVSFLAGHVYTITARGDITVAATTTCAANNRTCLDNTANR